jgi:hypothetical protein
VIDLNDLTPGSYLIQVGHHGAPYYTERLSGPLEVYIQRQATTKEHTDIQTVSGQVEHCLNQLRKATKAMRLDLHSTLI